MDYMLGLLHALHPMKFSYLPLSVVSSCFVLLQAPWSDKFQYLSVTKQLIFSLASPRGHGLASFSTFLGQCCLFHAWLTMCIILSFVSFVSVVHFMLG